VREDKTLSGQPAIFMDRDGTIIHDVGYPRHPAQVKFLPDVHETLSILQGKGYLLIIVSNQSGIGRGLLTKQEAESVHKEVVASLERSHIYLNAVHYCVHAPEEMCGCRKPSPEMILNAAKELDINLGRSFMIGDRENDIRAGKDAGCLAIQLLGDYGTKSCGMADFEAHNWQDILHYILEKRDSASMGTVGGR